MNIKKYGLLLCLLSIAQLSFAAIEPVDAEGDSDAKTIVVTATRTSETIDETLAPVTVFTREDIETSQAKTLGELLAKVPGVQVVQDGSQGSNTGLFIRGTNSNHALVLIDGLRSSSATLGTTDIQYVDLNQVERIEVVRGSRSSLYGSDAIGGVIQIFTKKGTTDKAFSPTLKLGGGSHGTEEGMFSASGRIDNTRYNASTSYYGTNGFNSTDSVRPIDFDHDQYRNRSNSFNVTQEFESGAKADVIYSHQTGRSDYDSIFTNFGNKPYTDFELQNISTSLKVPVTATWDISFQYGNVKNEMDNRYFDFTSFGMITTPINTDRDFVTWQNDISVGDNQLWTAGVDYYKDNVDSTNNYAHDTNENAGYFLQNQFSLGAQDFILSARHDDSNSYGEHDTGNASWGTDLTKTLRITAGAGTSFKAPTINDLYWPLDVAGPFGSFGFPCSADDPTIYDFCTYVTRGTPNIDPEEGKNFEIGLRGEQETFTWSANVFQNNISDLINWDATSVVTGIAPNVTKTITYAPNNIDDVKIQGLEASVESELAGWTWTATTTFLNPRDDNTGNLLPRRAKRTFNFDIGRSIGKKIDVGVSWMAQSQRYNDAANTAELAGYGIVGARATLHVNEEIDVQLKVNNIFDKDYVLSQQSGVDFEQDGVNAFMSVVYTPNLD